jgi:hypothetical protein
MKKWPLRIALSLRVLAAPAVAQFGGPSVQGILNRTIGSRRRGSSMARSMANLPEQAIDDALELLPTLITECANYFAHAGYARDSLAARAPRLAEGLGEAHSSSRPTVEVLLVNSPNRRSLPLTWNGTQPEPQRRTGQKNSLLRSSSA